MTLRGPERELHRRMAVRCFNEAWTYLEKKHRTAADDRQMLLLAHTSRFHWGLVGTPQSQSVGDWQISRAYAALGDSRLALAYARSCLMLCREHDLSDLLGTAYEAMARAYAIAGERSAARAYLQKAREQLATSHLDREAKTIYRAQIEDTERLIRGGHT
jgi:tetratricopeptide (TPR) repeat protein